MWILDTGCSSSLGPDVESLWSGLFSGRNSLQPFLDLGKVHTWNNSEPSIRLKIIEELERALTPMFSKLQDLNGPLGIILASTKGFVEEIVWQNEVSSQDPVSMVLEDFLKRNKIPWIKKLSVSTACTSSHSAYFLAQRWLERGTVDYVLVLSVDAIGPFIWKGFKSLGLISETQARPFAKDRRGLQLGEAAVAVLLSQKVKSHLEIVSVALDSEGSPVSRPSSSGRSLRKCVEKVIDQSHFRGALIPEVVVAHGTGTLINDQIEDQVFKAIFEGQSKPPVITGCKWSVGHTLGASGAIDLLAAIGILERQKVFSIEPSEEIDPQLNGKYLNGKGSTLELPVSQVLVSSLGFGGTHGALMLRREL